MTGIWLNLIKNKFSYSDSSCATLHPRSPVCKKGGNTSFDWELEGRVFSTPAPPLSILVCLKLEMSLILIWFVCLFVFLSLLIAFQAATVKAE